MPELYMPAISWLAIAKIFFLNESILSASQSILKLCFANEFIKLILKKKDLANKGGVVYTEMFFS